jgi:adenine-specific DNA-methyltransferase
MDARGEIYWSPTGNPRRKIYLDESAGVAVQDIWLDCRDAHNQNIAISGYPTEKTPSLLSRIIQASSNEGDIVLDCFSGSGTTLNVASHLGRRWMGVDNSREAIAATLRRFAKGLELMGDFVNKPGSADKDEELAAILPLFGADDLQKSFPKALTHHRAIKILVCSPKSLITVNCMIYLGNGWNGLARQRFLNFPKRRRHTGLKQ